MQGIIHSVRIASQHDIIADPHLPCRYILQPVENLPLLDLSRTLQSVLFSRSWDAAIKHFLRRYGHLFSVGYLVASILHTAIILVLLKEGRNLAIVAAILGLPTMIFSILRLRADIVRALIQSFDVVFSVFLITLTFGVLAVMEDDIQAIVDFEAWLFAFVNIFIDANIQGVRQIVFVSSFSVVSALCLLLVVVFELLPGVKHFDLLSIGHHTLTATDVVTSGLLTILALLARNIYRNRHILLRRSNGTIVESVSCRCRLRFHVTSGQRRMRNNLNARRRHSMHLKSTMPHLQPMRYGPQLTLINAVCIIHPALFKKLECNPSSFRRRCRGFGLAAASLTFIVG